MGKNAVDIVKDGCIFTFYCNFLNQFIVLAIIGVIFTAIQAQCYGFPYYHIKSVLSCNGMHGVEINFFRKPSWGKFVFIVMVQCSPTYHFTNRSFLSVVVSAAQSV